MDSLRTLSLGRNLLKKVENVEAVADTLQELWLSYNQIEKLVGACCMGRCWGRSRGGVRAPRVDDELHTPLSQALSRACSLWFQRLVMSAIMHSYPPIQQPLHVPTCVAHRAKPPQPTTTPPWWHHQTGLEKLSQLRVLFLSNNRVKDWSEVDRLSVLASLEDLLLVGNPLYNEFKDTSDYRLEVLKRLPNLKKLDGIPVDVDERDQALQARSVGS